MKILKYVFLLILLAVISMVVFIATQDGKYGIRKERIINVPQPLLYEYINDHRNWENIGVLTNNDTTAIYSFSEVTSGKGAVSTWKYNDTSGRIETLKVVENDSIIQKAIIDKIPSDLKWSFKKAPGGTKVAVRVQGNLSFSDKANAVFKGGVTEGLEEKIENGLSNLDNFLVHELKEFSIEDKGMVRRLGTFYLCQNTTGTISDMSKKVSEILPKLIAFTKENKIATNGHPFALYKTYDRANNNATYSVCIPIKEEIFTTPGSDIEGGLLEPFNAYKVTLKGYYSHLPATWDKAHKAVASKGIYENTLGQYIEVYTKGIKQTKKPSQWVTDIFIPTSAVPVVVPQPAPTTQPIEPSVSATGGRSAAPKITGVTPRPVASPETRLSTNTAPRPASQKPSGSSKPAATANVKPAQSKPAVTTQQTQSKPKPVPARKPAASNTQPRSNSMDEFDR